MRISELSRRTGVPVTTIKFYLREGLMPPGRLTAATQALYGEEHARRLHVIRALVEVGGLSLDRVRQVLAAIDDTGTDTHQRLGRAHHALWAGRDDRPGRAGWEAARAEVDALIVRLGWQVSAGAPGRDLLAEVLLTLRELEMPADAEDLEAYGGAAARLAEWEVSRIASRGRAGRLVEAAVLGTVLYEPVLLALHRLAQEDASARRLR